MTVIQNEANNKHNKHNKHSKYNFQTFNLAREECGTIRWYYRSGGLLVELDPDAEHTKFMGWCRLASLSWIPIKRYERLLAVHVIFLQIAVKRLLWICPGWRMLRCCMLSARWHLDNCTDSSTTSFQPILQVQCLAIAFIYYIVPTNIAGALLLLHRSNQYCRCLAIAFIYNTSNWNRFYIQWITLEIDDRMMYPINNTWTRNSCWDTRVVACDWEPRNGCGRRNRSKMVPGI